MKKKLVIVGALLLILALAVAGTVANSVTEVHTTNVVTTGVIDIELETGKTVTAEIGTYMPGMVAEKTYSVSTEKCSDPAWLRAKLTAEFTDEKLDPGKLSVTAAEGWIKGEDGFYYYKSPVDPKQSVELLKSIGFDKSMGNEYQESTAKLVVFAQAVQVRNNDPVEELTAENYTQIKGWPAE